VSTSLPCSFIDRIVSSYIKSVRDSAQCRCILSEFYKRVHCPLEQYAHRRSALLVEHNGAVTWSLDFTHCWRRHHGHCNLRYVNMIERKGQIWGGLDVHSSIQVSK